MRSLVGILLICFLLEPMFCNATTRIKDIVSVEGIRDNLLIGYGLVVGLNGTGDNLSNVVFTQKGLTDLLERMGVNTRGASLKTKNIAAVTVTASLPPFARHGSKINVAVSTIGDAKSLQGGTLLATPLLGADGEVYAVSQGPISLGGFSPASKAANTLSKAVATNGSIPNGAIIEKEIEFDLRTMKTIKLALHNPDISTALSVAIAVNGLFAGMAKAIDPGTVELTIPEDKRADVVSLLASLEQLPVVVDQPAKIIVDEGAGTIVIGQNVGIAPVAISQGNLSLTITNKELGPEDNIPGREVRILNNAAKLQDLVDGLNALGVGPRDLINILQNIKAAGALQADIGTR